MYLCAKFGTFLTIKCAIQFKKIMSLATVLSRSHHDTASQVPFIGISISQEDDYFCLPTNMSWLLMIYHLKWQLNPLSRFCRANGTFSLYVTLLCSISPATKFTASHGGAWSAYPTRHPKRHIDWRSHFSRIQSHYPWTDRLTDRQNGQATQPVPMACITGSKVAQPCVNSHWLSQWGALFPTPSQNRCPLTDRYKICHKYTVSQKKQQWRCTV